MAPNRMGHVYSNIGRACLEVSWRRVAIGTGMVDYMYFIQLLAIDRSTICTELSSWRMINFTILSVMTPFNI